METRAKFETDWMRQYREKEEREEKRRNALKNMEEIKKQSVIAVIEWFEQNGYEREEFDWNCDLPLEILLNDEEEQEDCELYLGGFWADNKIVIEFENGKVARWYHGQPWD